MICESNIKSVLMWEYGLDSAGLTQGQLIGFYEKCNVHFHENESHPSDILFTIIQKRHIVMLWKNKQACIKEKES
jgi:hypothetical protein